MTGRRGGSYKGQEWRGSLFRREGGDGVSCIGQEGGDEVSCIGQEELIFQLQCGVSITSVVMKIRLFERNVSVFLKVI